MAKTKHKNYFIIFWTVIRLLAPILLWWHALFGYLINMLFDAVDGDILERMKVKRNWYSNWDKLLDLWLYIFISIFVYFNFQQDIVWSALLILFFYRLIGAVLFHLTKKEYLLFIFPNIFSELFMISLLFPLFLRENFIFSLIVLIVFSLFKEWLIHIAKFDISDFLTGRKAIWK